jgi:hypothetical protein
MPVGKQENGMLLLQSSAATGKELHMTKRLQLLPASPIVRASIENVLVRGEKSGND